MSFGSSLDTKEQVKQAVDIVDLVGRYVQLRRSGRGYVGLCPWHDDTRPSMQVNPERQSFKCWVCDVGGDVFSFFMKIEGVEFREALSMLADQAGIDLQPIRPTSGQASSGQAADSSSSPEGKRALFRAMAWAETQYHDCLLNGPEAEPARRYLAERAITAESIEKFHLGFSPDSWDWILKRAQGSESRAKVLETIGLLAQPPDGGRFYDRFKGRVLFSIRDAQDRPVGLGGRVLPESGSKSKAKYINSPETPLFSKSKLLYGLDVARASMRKSRRALVMEGYTDCIVAHQYGFGDAVAVLGTALGEQHIRILKRFVDRIVLVLDGDEAGQRRANEVLELFVAQNVDLRILTLPEGLDPADFLSEHGAEAFHDAIDNRAVDALEHAFQVAVDGLDLDRDVHGASGALERLVAIVAKAPRLRADSSGGDRFREEKILQRLAAAFRVPEEEVRRRMTALRREGQRRPPTARPELVEPEVFDEEPSGEPTVAAEPDGPIDAFQRELLEIMVRYPHCVAMLRESIRPEHLASAVCRRIYQTACRLTDAGQEPSFAQLMLAFDDPATKSLLVELDEMGQAKGVENPDAIVSELIKRFLEREAMRRRPAIEGTLREGKLAEEEELDLLRQLEQQARARHGYSEPTDG